MKRRTPTQLERVASALERYGRITQIDFDGPETIDGLAPVRRVASRVNDLRAAGWVIDSRERRNGMAVYRVISRPETGPKAPGPRAPEAVALFDPPARRPAGPYDVEGEAA